MEAVLNYFAQPQNGILGIIIIMLLGVVIWQQRRLDRKDEQIYDLQEKSRVYAEGYSDKYLEATKEMISATRDNVNTTTLLQRSIDNIAQSIQNFVNRRG